MTKPNTLISIRDIYKDFENQPVLRGVSLDITEGEFFSILGPSGCGKTTLLRLLAGLEFPSSGALFIDGENMQGVQANHRPLNMVFQNYALFPHLNVRDNIAYGLRKFQFSRTKRSKMVGQMLEVIKLSGFEDRKTDQLSGGQQQRVALARALVLRPKALLLDEPFAALDRHLRRDMQNELLELQRTVGTTFILVTHDQEEALMLSDRVAIMSEGKVLQVARPDDLYEAPKTQDVANFLGTMNCISGTACSDRHGNRFIDCRGFGSIFVPNDRVASPDGTVVTIGLRPEKLSLSITRPGTEQCMSGTVRSTAYFGEMSYYQISMGSLTKPVVVASLNSERADNADRICVGMSIWLSWSPTSVILFN